MIPKVAHFHWTGRPMSWLRMASLATFRMMNPGWKIVLHDTPADIKKYGLLPAHEADWTWWRILAEEGGFQVATDIVFVKPIPDSWLDCDLNVCLAGTPSVYQFASMGASPGLDVMREVCSRSASIAESSKKLGYQTLGVDLLKQFNLVCLGLSVFDQPMSAFCSVTCTDVQRCWEPGRLSYPDDAIGIHWYGGHPSSIREWAARPGDDYAIMNLACAVLEGRSADVETLREQHGL